MIKKFSILLIALVALATAFASQADTEVKNNKISELRQTLPQLKSRKDSIKTLYNIFDLSTRKDQITVGKEIYHVAEREHDFNTQLDILRLMSSCYGDSASFQKIIDRARTLPASKERDETILFLKMKRLSHDTHYLNDEKLQKQIVQIIAEGDPNNAVKTKKDKNEIIDYSKTHKQLFKLYTLVEYLRNDAPGDLLKEYLDQLMDMANHSDIELYAIRNIIYSEIANIYSDVGDHEKAVEADRMLLKVVEGLEEEYAEKGRNHRNYDITRYTIYRRMLRNYPALSQNEIDNLHQKCLALAEKSTEVKSDLEKSPRYYAFYYMAKGDYNAAIPYLKDLLQKDKLASQVRKQVLENLVLAAEKTGDTKTRLEALSQYNLILEELNKAQSSAKYKELQIKYDVRDLKSRNSELELQARNDEINSERRIMTFVLVAFILLGLVLVALLFYWGKYKRNAAKMGTIVDRINSERRRIRNSIYNDSADRLDPLAEAEIDTDQSWQSRMKKEGIRIDAVSTFMTESIVNDLLYIASFGRDNRKKFIQDSSVDSIMRRILHNARELTDEKSRFSFEYPDDDYTIFTDSECLSVLLGHVLAIASEYSPTRSVNLSSRKTGEHTVDFVITIEGLKGATPNDPNILENFIRANNIFARQGSGLFICRMITLLLHSSHYPDTTYTEGARYIFSLTDDSHDS
ncbi:MAG: hypothetical protein K2G67_02830 [Muribaculaceae bacterium]|nr:hypothetical protein [Muribaculaceae bacterium]